MSALLPKADMCATRDVRYGPEADIAPLIRSPHRRRSKARRHGEAERFGGLEIDDQVELGRRLYRQVGRLCAFED
jgi:hypothetical protein